MPSTSELALRTKAVAALRDAYPGSRIIHELPLEADGVRMDLAAVWQDGLALVECKSERDTLDRLKRQVTVSGALGVDVWVCLAERWRADRARMSSARLNPTTRQIRRRDQVIARVPAGERNPNYVPGFDHLQTWYETSTGLERGQEEFARYRGPRRQDSALLLGMLHAYELGELTSRGSSFSRVSNIDFAMEHMTGRQIRRAVCVALRRRGFPNADPVCEPI